MKTELSRRSALLQRVLYRVVLGVAGLTLLVKIPAVLLILPGLNRAPSEPPPGPRGLALQVAQDDVFGSVTDKTLALLKTSLRPQDRFTIAASAPSVGRDERGATRLLSLLYLSPNVMAVHARDADVVLAIGHSALPPRRYEVVARDGSGNRVLRRIVPR